MSYTGAVKKITGTHFDQLRTAYYQYVDEALNNPGDAAGLARDVLTEKEFMAHMVLHRAGEKSIVPQTPDQLIAALGSANESTLEALQRKADENPPLSTGEK